MVFPFDLYRRRFPAVAVAAMQDTVADRHEAFATPSHVVQPLRGRGESLRLRSQLFAIAAAQDDTRANRHEALAIIDDVVERRGAAVSCRLPVFAVSAVHDYAITPDRYEAAASPRMPYRLARVARCSTGCQRRPSRLCTMAPSKPTATKRSSPQATPFKRTYRGVRELSQLSPSLLLAIVRSPSATKRPPPQITSVNRESRLQRAADQLLPSLLRRIVPSSPTATKSSPLAATLSRLSPVFPPGEVKPPPPCTNRHTSPAVSSGGSSARCASAGAHGMSSSQSIPNPILARPAARLGGACVMDFMVAGGLSTRHRSAPLAAVRGYLRSAAARW